MDVFELNAQLKKSSTASEPAGLVRLGHCRRGHRPGIMKSSQRLTFTVLVVLALAGAVGLILSGISPQPQPQSKDSQSTGAGNITIDQRYLDTARGLSALASTAQEQQVAQQVIHIADQELDKEFAAALQAVGSESFAQTPEVKDIRDRIVRIQTAIEKSRLK